MITWALIAQKHDDDQTMNIYKLPKNRVYCSGPTSAILHMTPIMNSLRPGYKMPSFYYLAFSYRY